MKAAVLFAPNDLRVIDIEKPMVGPNDVLVEVKAAAVCGTDLHVYTGGLKAGYPVVLGHEFSGLISEIGKNVTTLKVGQRVFGAPSVACGRCYYCQRGQENLCMDVKVFGIHLNGAFADYILTQPISLYELPKPISFEEGALIGDTVATTAHALMRAGVGFGDFVEVIGDGPIGLFASQVAKVSGAIVMLVGRSSERLKFAKETLGVDNVLNSDEEDPVNRVLDLTKGVGADITVEAVGIQQTFEQALLSAKRGGKILVIGIFEKAIPVNMTHVVYREKSIIGTFAHARCDMERILNLLLTENVQLKSFITETLPLGSVNEAIELFKERKATKVLLKPKT